ncbi:50S ribosomal protein L9 [Bienertia sinuspersici]
MIVIVPWTHPHCKLLLLLKKMNGDKLEKIYLGPHGAPPQSKQQESNISTSRKQRFKQKLKEADKKTSNTGRENRVESLREIVGTGGKLSGKMAKGQSKDWLDPHCDESIIFGPI